MANAGFGKMTDFFSLEKSGLDLVSSDSGEMSAVVYASTTGHYRDGTDGGSQSGGICMNPVCVYEITKDVSISFVLGKAFASSSSGKIGYMITSAVLDTSTGRFPTLTVSAVANEGADAINLYAVQFSVKARARPQDVLGAISTDGDLQTCATSWRCDPVVLIENLMPCASDVVHGIVTVSADIASYDGDSEVSAASGFAKSSCKTKGAGTGYEMYSFEAQKGL